jgi:hypothetical protein
MGYHGGRRLPAFIKFAINYSYLARESEMARNRSPTSVGLGTVEIKIAYIITGYVSARIRGPRWTVEKLDTNFKLSRITTVFIFIYNRFVLGINPALYSSDSARLIQEVMNVAS